MVPSAPAPLKPQKLWCSALRVVEQIWELVFLADLCCFLLPCSPRACHAQPRSLVSLPSSACRALLDLPCLVPGKTNCSARLGELPDTEQAPRATPEHFHRSTWL